MNIQGIILAGGKSSRMGTNKALLSLHNKKILEHIIEQMRLLTQDLIIIANEPTLYEPYGFPIYPDRYLGKGPLAGLETALYHMEGDVAVVTPCDTPFIHHTVYKQLLSHIQAYDAVVPKYDHRLHPLAGIYRTSVHPFIEANIRENNLRMTSFFQDVHVFVEEEFHSLDPSLVKRHFFNMNTIEDFQQAKEI